MKWMVENLLNFFFLLFLKVWKLQKNAMCYLIALKFGTQKGKIRLHPDTQFGCNTINSHKVVNNYSRKITPICCYSTAQMLRRSRSHYFARCEYTRVIFDAQVTLCYSRALERTNSRVIFPRDNRSSRILRAKLRVWILEWASETQPTRELRLSSRDTPTREL